MSKRNKAQIWILAVIQMVLSTLLVFALNYAISACASKEVSLMINTSSGDGRDRVLSELVTCGRAERLDLNDAPYERELVANLTTRTSFASSLLIPRLPVE